MRKITKATVKKFIRENKENLLISNKSRFDGMVDCVMPSNNQNFRKAQVDDLEDKYTLGIKGAWFVGSSRDYFTPKFNDNGELIEIEVYNSCGSFVLAKGGN